MSNLPVNQPNANPEQTQSEPSGLDLDSDAPLAQACPLNPGEGECEACS